MMKRTKISNLILFLCVGLLAIIILFLYNLNKRVLSLEKDFLSFKGKGQEVENKLQDDNLKEYHAVIIDYVKKNINEIALEKPVLGGRWIVTDIKFLSPDIIEVAYEDGHIAGGIFLKIESAFDSKVIVKPFW
ncbi:MAG: hypothetical protein A2Z08_10010 [Deltaproteobacteria bacterium RBG_16_54_11]|jgi:hypothetical protein|nr:MAG: hypothetical protein A2Z08_10010 [Deltaproteobacteria bacterium RBG_16_54_11]